MVFPSSHDVKGVFINKQVRPELSVDFRDFGPRFSLVGGFENRCQSTLKLCGTRPKMVVRCHIIAIGKDADARRSDEGLCRCRAIIDDDAGDFGSLGKGLEIKEIDGNK
jgi:hypothetical protein